jgi:acetyltransferase-like isoleucine patch superfamily enzyme
MILKLFRILNKCKNGGTTIVMRTYCFLIGAKLGAGVLFKGVSSLNKLKSAKIIIGKNTLINSNNFGYHLNMFNKCKLLADKPNAIIKIGDNCRIHGTCIHAFTEITIGNRVLIAANTQIIDGNGHMLSMENPENRINTVDEGKPIFIQDDVWIGTNVLVLGGVCIGQGAVISANTVVNKDVLPFSLVGGNPMVTWKNYRE